MDDKYAEHVNFFRKVSQEFQKLATSFQCRQVLEKKGRIEVDEDYEDMDLCLLGIHLITKVYLSERMES